MGKLRVLSGEEVCHILAAHGFERVRQRGSHAAMQHRGTPTVTGPVPLHRELRRGTLRAIVRQCGLPAHLFEAD